MASLNNALILRINTASGLTGAGQNDNVLGYGPNQSSPVIPNKKTETIVNLRDFLQQFENGDLINTSMRCDVGGVQASDVCTIASSADTGTYRTTINGVNVDATGTGTISTTCTAIANAINASTDALVSGLVTATAGATTVTITAIGSAWGTSGNCITVSVSGTNYSSAHARLVGGLDSYAAVTAAAASGTFTISSGSGTITAIINGVSIPVTWASSDSHTGDLLVTAITTNTSVNNRVTASNASGTVTISAKSKGSWGNTITLDGTGTGVTITNTTAGCLAGGLDGTIGYAEVTQTQASQTDTISGADSGSYTVVINGSTVTATGTGNDTSTAAAIATAILASTAVGVAGRVTATSSSGVVTVTALPDSVYAGSAGNSVTFTVTGTGATAGNTTLLGGLDGVTTRFTF
jgi:hypothetical protein